MSQLGLFHFWNIAISLRFLFFHGPFIFIIPTMGRRAYATQDVPLCYNLYSTLQFLQYSANTVNIPFLSSFQLYPPAKLKHIFLLIAPSSPPFFLSSSQLSHHTHYTTTPHYTTPNFHIPHSSFLSPSTTTVRFIC